MLVQLMSDKMAADEPAAAGNEDSLHILKLTEFVFLFKFANIFKTLKTSKEFLKMPEENCPFCLIADGRDIPEKTIHEYDHCLAIQSDPQLVKYHLLVIPKRHIEA